MSDQVTKLFNDFDRGFLSRRQLLQALGMAGVAAAAHPFSAFAQSACKPGMPNCDPTPAKLPFASTGWKTVLLDHFSMQVGDYEKEAAYFNALMNWKVRSDDGKQAVLDIGDWGGIVIRGGYQPPPPPPAPATPPSAATTAAAGAGQGAGRGQGGRGGGGGARTPRLSTFDSVCFGITPWDTKKVEAELKARGLNPVADHQSKDFQSFHVKDPDGFDLQISNGNRKNRRTTPAKAKLNVPAPFEATNWKTMYLDHISFEVTTYKEQVAFYTALLGWTPGEDTGSQNEMQIGDIGGIIVRRSGGGRGGDAAAPVVRRAAMGHIAFGITPFDPDAVKAELDKRGLTARVDTGGAGEIHVAKYKSYHTTTPNGYDLQISNVLKKGDG
jgi:catechol 2,3-dioxygenase-like lactoylglutathione lyase family enzyme